MDWEPAGRDTPAVPVAWDLGWCSDADPWSVLALDEVFALREARLAPDRHGTQNDIDHEERGHLVDRVRDEPLTEGRSLAANRRLIEDNAALAAEIARAYYAE